MTFKLNRLLYLLIGIGLATLVGCKLSGPEANMVSTDDVFIEAPGFSDNINDDKKKKKAPSTDEIIANIDKFVEGDDDDSNGDSDDSDDVVDSRDNRGAPLPSLSVNINEVDSALGWKGLNSHFQLSSNHPGVTYLCRIGAKGSIAIENFTPCDGAAGNGGFVDLSAFNGHDGAHQLDIKAVLNGIESEVESAELYIHSSLNGVSKCSPTTTDDKFFKAASQLIKSKRTFADTVELSSPFVKIPFYDKKSAREEIDRRSKEKRKELRADNQTWHKKFRERKQAHFAVLRERRKDLVKVFKQRWLQHKKNYISKHVSHWKDEGFSPKEIDRRRTDLVSAKNVHWKKFKKFWKKRFKTQRKVWSAATKVLKQKLITSWKLKKAQLAAKFRTDLKKQRQVWRQELSSEPAHFTSEIMSLRRKFVMSPDAKYILVRRTFSSSTFGGCGNFFTLDMRGGSNITGYQAEWFDCHAFVLNAQGRAVCLQNDGGEIKVVKFATDVWRTFGHNNSSHSQPFSRKTASDDATSDDVFYLPQ